MKDCLGWIYPVGGTCINKMGGTVAHFMDKIGGTLQSEAEIVRQAGEDCLSQSECM